jgi:rSAM/selenodomain-associated transferase 2
MKPEISVIIPTLNEAESLKETIYAVKKLSENTEIIIVDGGSDDATIEIAENCKIEIIQSKCGRGTQLHAGATAANGDILWFLHADTIPSLETIEQMKRALENPNIVGGNFTICFDGNSKPARFMTWLYPNLRKIGLLYGDSAIFVRRENYIKIGGFKSLSLFEDLEFINRLKRTGKLAHLPAKVTTSSRRFEGKSFTLTFLRWTIFQCLYWLGVNPDWLARRYYPIRKPKKMYKRRLLLFDGGHFIKNFRARSERQTEIKPDDQKQRPTDKKRD